MENETIENVNSTNDEETSTETEELEQDDTPTLEDYQKILEEKKRLEETNKKLYARLKSSSNKPLQKTSVPDDKRFERLELKTEGYNEDEIEFLIQYGGKEALKNPIVKTAIDVMREKSKAENAVVDSSNQGSDIEKKYTQAQLEKMSVAELEELIKTSTNR